LAKVRAAQAAAVGLVNLGGLPVGLGENAFRISSEETITCEHACKSW